MHTDRVREVCAENSEWHKVLELKMQLATWEVFYFLRANFSFSERLSFA